MYRINSFDTALREAFEDGEQGHGVIFIRTDETGRIKPCAPDKLLLSDVVSVRAGKMYLPARFQTAGARKLAQVGQALEALLPDRAARETETTITLDRALDILSVLQGALDVPPTAFDWSAMRALLTFYADRAGGRLKLYVERGRRLDRAASGDKSGRSVVGPALRAKLGAAPRSQPALVLLEQEGLVEQGWSGGRFWWPVLVAPLDVEPCVFASRTAA